MNPLLDKIVKKTADEMGIPEAVAYELARHQYKYTYTNISSQKTFEITGFGYFKLRVKNIKKKIKSYQSYLDYFEKLILTMDDENPKKKGVQKKIDWNKEQIAYLNSKIDV